jgi:hypothetical protein
MDRRFFSETAKQWLPAVELETLWVGNIDFSERESQI